MTNAPTGLNLHNYPINASGTRAYDDLVVQCQRDLDETGMFNLPAFMLPESVETLAQTLAPRFASEAFTHARAHNIYFKRDVPDLPPDHPAQLELTTINHTLCTDQLGGTPIRDLYEWPPFAAFLADVMGKPRLHRMDDPIAGLNAMAYNHGEALNWHFDRSEFTITLLLQAPEKGGAFQYRSNLRTEYDPNFDGVARMLAGEDDHVRTLHQEPGTLNVFKGVNTAHRVTPVEGNRARIIAVFCYYEHAGAAFTKEERLGFYGRAG